MKRATKQTQTARVKKESRAEATTDVTPEIRRWTPKPISTDRAIEICKKLAASFSGDERINLLLELVIGMSVDEDSLREQGYLLHEVSDYHYARGTLCAMELHRQSNHGWNAMSDYVIELGLAQEDKIVEASGKEVQ